MSSRHLRLPHALLDLTLVRAAALEGQGLGTRVFGTRVRFLQQAALRTSPNTHVRYDVSGDFYARHERSRARESMELVGNDGLERGRPLTELERRVMELKEAPVDEDSAPVQPTYSEEDFVSMYEDLLDIPPTQKPAIPEPVTPEADLEVLRAVLHSLYDSASPIVSLSDTPAQISAAITKLTEIVETLESTRSTTASSSLDVNVLPVEQWSALVRACVWEKDGQSAETLIDLMKRSGTPVPEELLNETLALYAVAGDIQSAEHFVQAVVGPSPSERQRDLHIKAHLYSQRYGQRNTTALPVLHDYEQRGLFPPQRSYTRIIRNLLVQRTSVSEAHAWDLFSHMRYVAHPEPDAFLYATMISACASRAIEPQPERALDLFTEMTQDKGIAPTSASYCAVITACASSGEKRFVQEAFRLAKEMLDGHRDAFGRSAFQPDLKMFCALLEGAKRVGDLAKVRWILAEMVLEDRRAREAGEGEDAPPGDVHVDEQVMMHVFHAYAAYKTTFKRGATVLVDTPSDAAPPADESAEPIVAAEDLVVEETPGEEPQADTPTPQDSEASGTDTARPTTEVNTTEGRSFSPLLPQSRPEVLHEARTLFSRILNDTGNAPQPRADLGASLPTVFDRVCITSRLLNAYLSVFHTHAFLDESIRLYRTLFPELDVKRNARTYIEALERCARARRGPERDLALKFAREVWEDWRVFEAANEGALNARLVERAHTAMIRILALTGGTQEAVGLVRAFVRRFPPEHVRLPNPGFAERGMRPVLVGARPLVRMLGPVDVPDDAVPPMLSFPELEILHHRLVAAGDAANIRYVHGVCMAYAGALRKRRERTMLSAKAASKVGE